MDVMTSNRRDVDDRTLALGQCWGEGARQNKRHEEIQLKYPVPIFEVAVENTEAFFRLALWGDTGIVDERMQGPPDKPTRLGDKALEVGGIGKIRGDVVGPIRVTLAFRRHGVSRAGDDAPAGVAETLDRCVAD